MRLQQLHRRLAAGDRSGAAALAAIALAPAALLFKCAVSLRNWSYDRGFLRERVLPRPVICVGALTAGGSGKTPFAAYIANLALDLGGHPLLAAHGYGASGSDSRLISAAGGQTRGVQTANARADDVDWRAVGEESVLLARLAPRVPVAVAHDRATALEIARSSGLDPDLLVLDGGFQDRSIHKDIAIVLLDASHSPRSARMLPVGDMREGWGSLRRASVIVLHRSELCRDRAEWEAHVKRWAPDALCIWSANRWREPRALQAGASSDRQPGANPDWRALAQMRLGVWTAIAKPAAVLAGLAERGIRPLFCEAARDHADFGKKDVARLQRVAREIGLDGFVTTEKDAVKMESFAAQLPPVWIIPAEIELESVAELRARIATLLNPPSRRSGPESLPQP